MAGACSKKTADSASAQESQGLTEQVTMNGVAIGYRNSKPMNTIPKASAFRMSGDYADNVAITIRNGSLSYFPDPSDISDNSRPIDLGNGWWLNRQGISANSVFTKYTFDEYAALKKVPSVKERKPSIIPGARVTEMRELPFTINEAPAHLDSIRSFLTTPQTTIKTIITI